MARKTSKKKKKRKGRVKKALVVAGAVVIVAGGATVRNRYVDPREKVVSVIDGDSFVIGNEQVIRLHSLDAPQIDYCFGKEAKNALSKKIMGKKIVLKELKTDRFGRIMAMVYVNGEFINEYLIKNGYANHTWNNASYNDELDKVDNFARKNKLGIFSEKCSQMEPQKKDCDIKGNIIQETKNKEYMMPTCKMYSMSIVEKYKGEEWFCTEKEAKKAGYVKSKNCK